MRCRRAEEYVKKIPQHPRFGGKQIGVAWPKQGKTVDTYFQKEHKWVYNGCKFNDRLMYASQQSKPTRGFMTSDYHRRRAPPLPIMPSRCRSNCPSRRHLQDVREAATASVGDSCAPGMPPARTAAASHCWPACRDEFSLDFRTEQYREQLKMEDKYAKRALDQMRTANAADSAGGSAADAAAPRFGITEGIDKPFLYDLVFEEHDAAHSGASKVHRYVL